ncbi:MAG: IPT/TIG domain-containing protein, partial [Actinomycetales bacterium]|nr:IPT/TIG domain-containing protein [Actinomycetales bacterium]
NGNSTYGAATPVTRTFMVLGITTGSIANGTVGQGYSQSLTADGGSSGNYTWSLVSGNLAQYGLALSNLGVISGTPSQQSTALGFTITVQVDDSGVTTTRQYTIVINPAQIPTIPLVYKVSPNRSLTTGGGTSVISGNNLQGATQVVVGGIIAQITSNNNSQITFIIPARQVGTVDILLTVQAGSLRIASAMTYYELPKPSSAGGSNGGSNGGTKPTDKDVIITISGFAPGSPAITGAIKAAITKFIKANPGYKHMYCTGFTMGPTVLPVDFALSTNRATASCAVALSVNPTLTAKSQVGLQETTVGNQIRRVTIRLSNK